MPNKVKQRWIARQEKRKHHVDEVVEPEPIVEEVVEPEPIVEEVVEPEPIVEEVVEVESGTVTDVEVVNDVPEVKKTRAKAKTTKEV